MGKKGIFWNEDAQRGRHKRLDEIQKLQYEYVKLYTE
jgi:hypothetical protein